MILPLQMFDKLDQFGQADQVATINAIADESPGFVWRLETDEGDATAIRPYPDERVLINLTVWESVESLTAFVYRTAHGELVRDGRSWFEAPDDSSLVLWWIPRGQLPTADEGVAKLEQLHREGPSAAAFTFRKPWGPPVSSPE